MVVIFYSFLIAIMSVRNKLLITILSSSIRENKFKKFPRGGLSHPFRVPRRQIIIFT